MKILNGAVVVTFAILATVACTDKSSPNSMDSAHKLEQSENRTYSCKLPAVAVNVGTELDSAWGANSPGAFPFKKGGGEIEPGNVALSLELNFKVIGIKSTLVSVTGSTTAGDKIYLPALLQRPVIYSPPAGGYTDTPGPYAATGCDSIWTAKGPAGGLATSNPDGSYKAQCASFAVDVIPAVFTIDGSEFTADLNNPAVASYSDAGKVGWSDPNTGLILLDGKAYGRVTRGWEIAANLQQAGIANFSPAQIPWHENRIGQVSGELVRAQTTKFGATASDSASDYTYRTDGYDQTGKWLFSHSHYSIGIPKSGPGRLSAGVAMFRVKGNISEDGKIITVRDFSFSGPMLVCPANGQECTASPGRSFVGLTCSVILK